MPMPSLLAFPFNSTCIIFFRLVGFPSYYILNTDTPLPTILDPDKPRNHVKKLQCAFYEHMLDTEKNRNNKRSTLSFEKHISGTRVWPSSLSGDLLVVRGYIKKYTSLLFDFKRLNKARLNNTRQE